MHPVYKIEHPTDENNARILAAASICTIAVRHTLARASDKQLAHSNLTAEQRDKLLEKPVLLSLHEEDSHLAEFSSKKSRDAQASHISFNQHIHMQGINDFYTILKSAAHENFHAAKFWSGKSAHMLSTPVPMLLTGGGAAALLTSAFTFSPELAIAGIQFTASGLYQLCTEPHKNLHEEESGAHRFGYIFSDLTYRNGYHPKAPDKTKAKKRLKPGYPSQIEQHSLFIATVKECIDTPAEHLFFRNLSDLGDTIALARHSRQSDEAIKIDPAYAPLF